MLPVSRLEIEGQGGPCAGGPFLLVACIRSFRPSRRPGAMGRATDVPVLLSTGQPQVQPQVRQYPWDTSSLYSLLRCSSALRRWRSTLKAGVSAAVHRPDVDPQSATVLAEKCMMGRRICWPAGRGERAVLDVDFPLAAGQLGLGIAGTAGHAVVGRRRRRHRLGQTLVQTESTSLSLACTSTTWPSPALRRVQK